jgi:hypothetical protein
MHKEETAATSHQKRAGRRDSKGEDTADGLPIFDAGGQPLFQIPGGGVASAIGTVADINPTNGVPRGATGADIPQPPLLVRINALVAHATATATATATTIANLLQSLIGSQ